jgi:hypothetical protein
MIRESKSAYLSAIPQLHHKNDRPRAQHHAVDQPKRHATGKRAVHGQRNAAHVFGAEGFDGLRQETASRKKGGECANEINDIHGGCYLFDSAYRSSNVLKLI